MALENLLDQQAAGAAVENVSVPRRKFFPRLGGHDFTPRRLAPRQDFEKPSRTAAVKIPSRVEPAGFGWAAWSELYRTAPLTHITASFPPSKITPVRGGRKVPAAV